MKPRRLALPILPLLLAAAPPAAPDPLEGELVALEKQSWEAWQRQDAGFWERFLSDDHVELNNQAGPVGRSAVIGGIAAKACRVRSYALDKFSFRRFGPDSAMLVYRASQDTSCGRFTVPSPAWATSLFARRHGRWVNVFYSHTPIPPTP